MTLPQDQDERFRVLALDPDPTFVHALEVALTERGFELLPLSDTAAALDALRADPEGFDVFAVGDAIAHDVVGRARENGTDLAIVLLSSGGGADRVAEQARELGALDVIERTPDEMSRAALTLGAAATCARLARKARLLRDMMSLTTPCDRATTGEPGTPEGDLAWSDPIPYGKARELVIQTFERRYVARLLRRADGNLAQASRLARLDRSNLRRLLMRHGLRVDNWRTVTDGD